MPTSVLPTSLRRLFPYQNFNPVQSACFDPAYSSDNSLVVAAPTGSGKTGVLELALARLFSNGQKAGGGRALAVYMAPLKALTHERYLDWQRKLHPLQVVELTGDSADESADERAVASADLIVTTPEKWDSFTRFKRDAQGVLGRLAVLLVDEVHALVDESRGPTLEAAIARMRTVSQGEQVQGMPIAKLRVLAASATMSNIDDIAAWLGPATAVRQFGEEYRPVPLRWRVLTYPMGKVFAFDKMLTERLYSVIREHSSGRPSLCFCNSRKVCQQAASQVANSAGARLIQSNAHREHLSAASARLGDKGLAQLVRFGVGYHDASLEVADKRTVEVSR